MKSEAFIQGMLEKAEEMLKDASWWQIRFKARLRGWIKACKLILEKEE